MSRHNLQPIDANHQIVVGWDPPLGNSFLQVIDPSRDDENEVLVWLGADGIGTETNVDRILDKASKWAGVPADLRQVLVAEQAANPERTPEFVRDLIRTEIIKDEARRAHRVSQNYFTQNGRDGMSSKCEALPPPDADQLSLVRGLFDVLATKLGTNKLADLIWLLGFGDANSLTDEQAALLADLELQNMFFSMGVRLKQDERTGRLQLEAWTSK